MIVYLTSQSGFKMSFLFETENGQKLRTTHKAYHWLNNISTNWKKWSSGQMWIRRVFKWVHDASKSFILETHSAPLMVYYLSTIWCTAFGTILKTKTSKRESKNVSRWFRIISKSQFLAEFGLDMTLNLPGVRLFTSWDSCFWTHKFALGRVC